jgi:phage N-6-adenine-methyltransferase
VSISAAAEMAREPAELQEKRLHFRTRGTGCDEWFTPAEYIALARDVLGNIDLDPASCEVAQARVKATQYFTLETDGLKQEWHGKVWVNPPYSQPLIEHFARKIVKESEAGRVTEAIMLTNNCTDTVWFHTAEKACARICFTKGRISFESADGGKAGSPIQGQTFFYYGPNADRFRAVFSTIGFVR